jgi:hypothetical protein
MIVACDFRLPPQSGNALEFFNHSVAGFHFGAP